MGLETRFEGPRLGPGLGIRAGARHLMPTYRRAATTGSGKGQHRGHVLQTGSPLRGRFGHRNSFWLFFNNFREKNTPSPVAGSVLLRYRRSLKSRTLLGKSVSHAEGETLTPSSFTLRPASPGSRPHRPFSGAFQTPSAGSGKQVGPLSAVLPAFSGRPLEGLQTPEQWLCQRGLSNF